MCKEGCRLGQALGPRVMGLLPSTPNSLVKGRAENVGRSVVSDLNFAKFSLVCCAFSKKCGSWLAHDFAPVLDRAFLMSVSGRVGWAHNHLYLRVLLVYVVGMVINV